VNKHLKITKREVDKMLAIARSMAWKSYDSLNSEVEQLPFVLQDIDNAVAFAKRLTDTGIVRL